MDPRLRIGPFLLEPPEEIIKSQIPIFKGREFRASICPWIVRGEGDLELVIHMAVFEDSPHTEFGQVYCHSREYSSPEWDDIVGRLRIGIRRVDENWLTMDLRAAIRQNNDRASRRSLDFADLEQVTGMDLRSTFQRFGAAINSREKLFGETNRNRNRLAVRFKPKDFVTPVVVWVLTTVATLT